MKLDPNNGVVGDVPQRTKSTAVPNELKVCAAPATPENQSVMVVVVKRVVLVLVPEPSRMRT